MPWSLRLMLVLVLASAGLFAWSKRPWVSDVEKVCHVARLSECPGPELSFVDNECKLTWLERSLWRFDRLAQLPHGRPDSGDLLRALAHEAGVPTCPEADVVDREFARRQEQAAAAQRAQAEPEPAGRRGGASAVDGDAAEEPSGPRARGVVKGEAPSVDGELDPSLVSKEVRARIGAVKACYERALRRKPSLAGKIKLRWTITAAGAVSTVEVEEDSMGDTNVTACIKGLVARWRFVAPTAGSVDVVYPFIFQPAP